MFSWYYSHVYYNLIRIYVFLLSHQERDAALKMFKGRKGKALASEMGGNKVRTFVPGTPVPAAVNAAQTTAPQRPKQDMDAIKVQN